MITVCEKRLWGGQLGWVEVSRLVLASREYLLLLPRYSFIWYVTVRASDGVYKIGNFNAKS